MRSVTTRNNYQLLVFFLAAMFAILAFTGCEDQGDDPVSTPPVDTTLSWANDISGVLHPACASCHSGAGGSGGFDITNFTQVSTGTSNAGNPYVVAGDADASELFWRLEGSNNLGQMPPTGALAAEDIQLVRDWIDDGAEE